jgi:hypothetical protein
MCIFRQIRVALWHSWISEKLDGSLSASHVHVQTLGAWHHASVFGRHPLALDHNPCEYECSYALLSRWVPTLLRLALWGIWNTQRLLCSSRLLSHDGRGYVLDGGNARGSGLFTYWGGACDTSPQFCKLHHYLCDWRHSYYKISY